MLRQLKMVDVLKSRGLAQLDVGPKTLDVTNAR